MNILVVNSKYPPEYAGSALRAHNTYLRLQKKYGINVIVLSSSITFTKSKNYSIDGINVYRIFSKLAKYLNKDADKTVDTIKSLVFRKFFKLIEIICESVPAYIFLAKNYHWADVIHVFGNVTVTSAAISFAKITKKPIMVELVNLVDRPGYYEPKFISLLFGNGYPKHATIVAISKALEKNSIKVGVEQSKIWCRPNPIDEKRFFYRDNNTCQEPGHDKIILLQIAKFMPRKNQIFLIDVMKHLPSNYNLILAGPFVKAGTNSIRDKEYFDKINSRIKASDLEANITLIPEFVNNPELLLEKSDIFVFPTKDEGLGTPVLEALACGIPVVANDIPGVFDQWIVNGKNGFICELNARLWAKKIIDSTKIGKASMKTAAEEIKDKASTAVIDTEYYKRLKYLSRPEKETFLT